MEDADKITDFKEYAKTSKTINMDPSRFECIMNKTALKQEPPSRLYMQALSYYNGDEQAEENKRIQMAELDLDRMNELRVKKHGQGSTQSLVPPGTAPAATEGSRTQTAQLGVRKCPARRLDTALNPELQGRA